MLGEAVKWAALTFEDGILQSSYDAMRYLEINK